MQFQPPRWKTWLACLMVVGMAQIAIAQAPATVELTKEQDRAARDFLRGKIGASEEAKQALALKIRLEVEKLRAPEARNFEESENLAKLDDLRYMLDSSYISGARDPEARKIVCKAVADTSKEILAQNVSVHTKINLLALLAEMDEKAAAGDAPPDPSSDALGILFTYANTDKSPPYLRAIALYGLNRHLGRWYSHPTHWPKGTKDAVVNMLVAVVQSEPKSALDAAAHAWVQRRAYDCLISTGSLLGGNAALKHLADPETPPSVRLSAMEYLSRLDMSAPNFAAYNAQYLVGAAHLLRSQLVEWYEREDDLLRSKSGAMAGMGGMGGYGGGGYGGEGGGYGAGMGMDSGMMMGGGYGGGGYGAGMAGGAYGGEAGYGGAAGGRGGFSRPKPKDTQTWQVRLARRLVNQISQAVHIALDGKPLAEEAAVEGVKPISAAQLPPETQQSLATLIKAVDEFQTAINDPLLVRDMNSLLRQAEGRIEEIMDLVKLVPGFLDRYPDLAEDDELETASQPTQPQQPADEPGQPEAPSDGVEPAAPADNATAQNN